jgi:threonyl-tRNA synthetase
MAYENKDDQNIPNGYDPELYRLRHTASHIMAQAVMELFPETKLAIGPPIENGFYYDFDLGKNESGQIKTFTPEDLEKIKKKMRQIISQKIPLEYSEISGDEAKKLFSSQPYKLELIDGLLSGGTDEDGNPSDKPVIISIFKQAEFVDLCRGPHAEHTGKIPGDAFDLLNVAGAYWRGDENNAMLQRIYGTAWKNKKDLEEHLKRLEEAKKRDHRKLGKELEIFIFDDEIGPGLPLWLPRGGIIIEELEKLAKEMELEAGYDRVKTPHLTKETLFLKSGHLPYYAESMYPPMVLEGVKYYMKPMNCPFHHKIFGSKMRSYRDLPVRLAEYGTCYRYEKSGELFGLMRVRSMQMNDAHIYCSEEQFEQEFMAVVGMYLKYFKLFGIDRYVMRLSTHDKKNLGKKFVDNERLWLKTEDMVRKVMIKGDVPFVEVAGEAAFYGPKIDVQIWSAIGKEFTLATNQVDFAVPERFSLVYTNKEGKEETPLCLHRAPLSTHERMIGFLLEHFAGNFPVWISPDQVRIIPISETQNEYATGLVKLLKEQGVRSDADLGDERMNAKVRKAQMFKIPYMLIVGDNEIASGTVSLRKRDGTKQDGLKTDEFIRFIKEKINTRDREI